MAVDAIVEPTEMELHRAAAWWAGEGSVRFANRKLAVSFCQKERCVCDWFLVRFGGSVAVRKPKANGIGGEVAVWSACGDKARRFIRAIVDLIPESPRREKQLRDALEQTAGRLKTGTKPSLVCIRGHVKESLGATCKACARIWATASRARPHVAQRHRERERDRYRNDPVFAAKVREKQRLLRQQEGAQR